MADNNQIQFKISNIRADEGIALYRAYGDPSFDGLVLYPWTFTGWKDETMSWKETCYLGAVLSTSLHARITGPDATTFMKKYLVNGFEKWRPGSGRHGIIVSENEGQILCDGVALRTGENSYETYFMSPVIQYFFEKGAGSLDIKYEDLFGKTFLYQLGGPRSLEIVEQACQEDLHDLKFMKFRDATIAGHKVRVLRMGMAGTLSYEVHGVAEDALDVYNALYDAGQPFGIRRLGWQSYNYSNHTENGYPQGYYHFSYPWEKEPGLCEWLGMPAEPMLEMRGSLSDDRADLAYVTPYDTGWGSRVKFDHDFHGRAALEKAAADQKRTTVTLEWNVEDCVDVYASMFTDEPYDTLDVPYFETYKSSDPLFVDEVKDADGNFVGISTGRVMSWWGKRMISLCTLDKGYATEGTELYITWGEKGHPQKVIRATVTHLPYFNVDPNNKFDVEQVPHFKKAE